MNRYEILLGKEPPKEDLVQAEQARESSARSLDPNNYVMGVDVGSGDSTSVIQADSSNNMETLLRFVPQPGEVAFNAQNNENLHVGDIVGYDASGAITLDRLGVSPVGVVTQTSLSPEDNTVVVRYLTADQKARMRALHARAMQSEVVGETGVQGIQGDSGIATAQHYEEQVSRPERERQRELIYDSEVSGDGTQTPSHRGILHEHPRMQQNLQVPNDHVIIDRNEWVRARRRSDNR